MSERTDYQKYLDEKFRSLEKMIEQNHKQNKIELRHIRSNTERTNGKVADHERRIREQENKRLSCPISRVVEEQQRIKKETRKMRAFSLIFKGSSVLAFFAALTLLLQILNVL